MERRGGSAAELHALEPPQPVVRTAWVLAVRRPALVLGPTQPAVVRTDIEVARRRSGGGGVLLDPADLWVDLLIPRDDPLWQDDVGVAVWWVGEVFAAAIGGDAHVHRGAMVRSPWSDAVCFAGLGPGEVTAGAGGPKLVGISQRRTRTGARFQCLVPRRWDAVGIARLAGVPVGRDRRGGRGQPPPDR